MLDWTPSSHSPAPSRGFTLVEILVALVVIQVGLLSLLAVIPLSQAQVTRAGHRSEATQLARQGLETLRRLSYSDSLLVAGTVFSDPMNPIDGRFNRTWQVEDDAPVPGCKMVTVDVAWSEGRRTGAVEARTVKAQY